jgi:Fe-S oxidoreductase
MVMLAIHLTRRDVAMDSPGCLLQIRGGCRSRGIPVRVAHTAEIVAEALKG